MRRTTHSPHLLIGAAVLALAGSSALVAGNVVGSILVPGHDWMAETVSDLGAGPLEIVQDVALYGYAAGLAACAVGAAHAHMDGLRWSGGILCLLVLAALVVVIGARNEYGDGDREGVVVHMYLVYLMGLLFLLGPLLMARGMGHVRAIYRRLSLGCGIVWGIGAPLFFMAPTDIDGLIERLLGIVSIVWILTLARFFVEDACGAGEPS